MSDVALSKAVDRLATVLLGSGEPMLSQASYVPSAGVTFPDEPDIVERDGYMTVEQQVREIMRAGGHLADWRAAQYPADLGDPAIPVFMDPLTAMDRYRELAARRAEREAEARRLAEVEAGVATEPVPEPVKPAPVASPQGAAGS